MATDEQETKKQRQNQYRAHVSDAQYGDYKHVYVDVFRESEYSVGRMELVGTYVWQCDKDSEKGTKETAFPNDGYSHWYGGERVELGSSWKGIHGQYEMMRDMYQTWQKIQKMIERYNLGYKYDGPTAMIAALNRMGYSPVRYDRLADRNESDYRLTFYK